MIRAWHAEDLQIELRKASKAADDVKAVLEGTAQSIVAAQTAEKVIRERQNLLLACHAPDVVSWESNKISTKAVTPKG